MTVPMTTTPSCPEVTGQLSAYLDAALPPDRRQGMEAHLAVCPECTRALSELRCTRRLLRSLPGPPAPARIRRPLLETLRMRRPHED
jgi:anti-sigma factor RsiW